MAAPLKLRGRALKAAVTAHALSSAGWFGAAGLVAFLALAGDHRPVEEALWLTVPLGVLSFATGIVLSLGTRWGIVRYWWVVIKLGINLAVVVTDLVVLRPAAHHAVVTGSAPRLSHPAVAHTVVLAVAIGLSVSKPPARTRRGRALQRTPAAVGS